MTDHRLLDIRYIIGVMLNNVFSPIYHQTHCLPQQSAVEKFAIAVGTVRGISAAVLGKHWALSVHC